MEPLKYRSDEVLVVNTRPVYPTVEDLNRQYADRHYALYDKCTQAVYKALTDWHPEKGVKVEFPPDVPMSVIYRVDSDLNESGLWLLPTHENGAVYRIAPMTKR